MFASLAFLLQVFVPAPVRPPLPTHKVKHAAAGTMFPYVPRTFIGRSSGAEVMTIIKAPPNNTQWILCMTQVTAPNPL